MSLFSDVMGEEVHFTPPTMQEVPGKEHVGIHSITVVEKLILYQIYVYKS